jgi:hypothetical protein
MRGSAALGLGAIALLVACAGEPRPAPRATVVAAPPPAPQRTDWSKGLSQLLPGIEACLAGAGGTPVGVTKAWPIGEELTGVRVLDAGGDRLDCVALADGRKVLLTEKVRASSRLAGERNPLFTPAVLRPPASPCADGATARDAAGGEVGWLTYDACSAPGGIGPSAGAAPAPPRRLPPQG